MFKKFFQRIRYKMMAAQLRRPHGAASKKVGAMMNKANEILYDRTLQIMQPDSSQQVLEIGFGNGHFFKKIFAIAGDIRVTGIDYSKEMVAAATAVNDQLLQEGRLQLFQGNSNALPFADKSYDAVFCINVAYFWDQPSAHLHEIRRILKPGGRFYCTLRSKETMDQVPFTKYGFTAYTVDRWKQITTENGLTFIDAILIDEVTVFNGQELHLNSYCMIHEI